MTLACHAKNVKQECLVCSQIRPKNCYNNFVRLICSGERNNLLTLLPGNIVQLEMELSWVHCSSLTNKNTEQGEQQNGKSYMCTQSNTCQEEVSALCISSISVVRHLFLRLKDSSQFIHMDRHTSWLKELFQAVLVTTNSCMRFHFPIHLFPVPSLFFPYISMWFIASIKELISTRRRKLF